MSLPTATGDRTTNVAINTAHKLDELIIIINVCAMSSMDYSVEFNGYDDDKLACGISRNDTDNVSLEEYDGVKFGLRDCVVSCFGHLTLDVRCLLIYFFLS